MNVAPLHPEDRERMIAWLAEGLTDRAKETMRGLSDGHLRTIYEAEFARAWSAGARQQVEAAMEQRALATLVIPTLLA